MIENLLIPGRHHLLTNFQYEYLQDILSSEKVTDLRGDQHKLQSIPNIIWPVTSANHSNTKRNPIPSNRREQAIESFCSSLDAKGFSYPINYIGRTPRFADFVIKEIEVQSCGQFRLTPTNTLVICSTPSVIKMYEKLGYAILQAELADLNTGKYDHITPSECMSAIVAAGDNWRQDPTYLNEVHDSSRQIFDKYRLGDLMVKINSDPLLGAEGDITNTRDYEMYRKSLEAGAKRKYNLVKSYIKSGRIVDIGCATGEIIKLMSENPDLAESDIYGIEAAQNLYQICEQRRQNEYFHNENVFFYQRNIMTDVIFPNDSVDTTTTFSLTHEIESYLGRDALRYFIKRLYDQTDLEGVFINSDVVGPDEKDKFIYMKLADDDGKTESWDEIDASPQVSTDYLNSLSTLGRFKRFARDFRAEENDRIEFKESTYGDDDYITLRLADACEFMSKKDYTDSWYSEMHERFYYWNFNDWKKAVTDVGFKVHEDSYAYRNNWIIENRYKGKVELFDLQQDTMKPYDYPVTNMLLIAEKLL